MNIVYFNSYIENTEQQGLYNPVNSDIIIMEKFDISYKEAVKYFK